VAQRRHGPDLYMAGHGLGIRCVLPDTIRAQADPEYESVNRRAFETLKTRFDHWAIYDNSVDGRPPGLVESSEPERRHDLNAAEMRSHADGQ